MIIIKLEIPNYDDHTKNKKFKQLFPFMPDDTFRMLICGNSGSGKTNLLLHMILSLLCYDEIFHYAKNLDQEKYQILINEMNKMNKGAGYDIMTVSNDKIIPIKDLSYEDNQKLVVFDDYVCEKIRDKLLIILSKADTKIVLLFI